MYAAAKRLFQDHNLRDVSLLPLLRRCQRTTGAADHSVEYFCSIFIFGENEVRVVMILFYCFCGLTVDCIISTAKAEMDVGHFFERGWSREPYGGSFGNYVFHSSHSIAEIRSS